MDSITNRFEWGARMLLYVLAAMFPLFVLPIAVRLEFGREVVFAALIIAAAVLWFLSILTTGEIRLRHSPVCWAGIALLVVAGLATIFSRVPFVSFIAPDAAAESFANLALASLLMIVASSVMRSREDAGTAVLIMIFAGAVSALLTLVQLFSGFTPYRWLIAAGSNVDFNVVGTINGMSLFYAAFFAMGLGTIFSASFENWKTSVKYAVWGSLGLFFLNVLMINFRMAWGAMLVAGVVAFGFSFMNLRSRGGRFDWRYAVTILLIVVSVVMLIMQTSLVQFAFPAEVSPSLRSTWNIARSVWQEGIWEMGLGSGLGTFGLDWNLYKDPVINSTIFWSLRFNQGFSWVATTLATMGILGVVVLAVFLLALFGVHLRAHVLSRDEDGSLSTAALLGLTALITASFIYPANLTLILVLFYLGGISSVFYARSDESAGAVRYMDEGNTDDMGETRVSGGAGFWDVKEYARRLESPWLVFISSLLIIVLLSIGVAAIYTEFIRVRATLALSRGNQALSAGSPDAAIAEIEQAISIDPKNFRNHMAMMQARTEKIKQIIGRAAAGENVQQEFQSQLALAIQNAQRVTELNSREPLVWRGRAALYEVLIPYIQGSERGAFEGYQRASELDPRNPTIFTDWGRAGLIYADRLLLLSGQVSGAERESLVKSRESILKEVDGVLEKAVAAKPDFAQAHFLAAQTAIRLGNLTSAIRATENAKATAPFDIGVAFQLGLLYYQASNFDAAQVEFERAVTMDQNYSNARYFLGLIYDRKGEKARAIEQFEKIEALNPGNQEVMNILQNLRGSKGALTGIVPPAEPPEKRTGTPVEVAR